MTPYDNVHIWEAGNVLTAAQMNQLSDELHRMNDACNEVIQSVVGLRDAMHVCPFCGGTKHHKGFREWEECDGCAAEWRMG
jgi:hypothetical protein